jgi:hypothetical protein
MRIIHGIATIAAAAAVGLAGTATAGADVAFTPGSVTGTSDSAQAGAHADFHTAFELQRGDNGRPTGTLKDLDVDLPKGFVGNPQATPTCSPRLVQQRACPAETAIGVARFDLLTPDGSTFGEQTEFIYNVTPRTDQPAAFMFQAVLFPIRLDATVRADGSYGIRANIRNLTEAYPLLYTKIDLWGVPADRQGPGGQFTSLGEEFGGPRAGAERIPFVTNPTTCTGAATETTYAVRGWVGASPPAETAFGKTQSGCDALPFAPSVDVEPTSARAGAPSGYNVDVTIPQSDDPDAPATGHLKDAVVTLPQGVSISPPGANGLGACTDEQLGLGRDAADDCPNEAKIGTVDIETPLLAKPLEGSLYLGSQKSSDPASGEMYRLFLTAAGSGVRVKLRGAIAADPKTGQLTARFLDNPELPFSRLSLRFKDGDRAPLVNPPTCGSKTAESTLTSWSGKSAADSDAFTIDQGCPTGQFVPAFTAGTMDPIAGGLSPFVMTTTRTDADQDLSKIRLDLPSGLLGALGSVPVCADAQAAAGTCGANTRIGSTQVAVGTGSNPYSLPGTVSLAGPYKGAPFSLSIAVPAKAGPLDLGMVVVRSPLIVDANKARVSAPVDDLPQIVGGVPMHYRSISVALDRAGFMFNATSCSPQTVAGTLTSSNGVEQRPGVRYQAQGCDKLKLSPSLKLAYSGRANLKKGKNPKFTADLGQTFGQAGLKRVRVALPLTSTLKADNANALCTPAQAAARDCPAASIVGRASATTPALHEPLTGPVYFLQGTKRTASGKIAKTLPKLWLKLRGDGVDLDLRADSATDNKTKQLIATFVDIPDAPIANFKLEIDGGPKGILGAPNDRDPCTSSRRATVQFDGQNGARTIRALNIAAPECGVRASMNASASQVRFGFTGIAAGKVSVSGKGLTSTSRTVKSGDRATVTASLTAATRRQIASGRTVKLRLTATFDPKAKGKTTKITKTVTIKGAKKRR